MSEPGDPLLPLERPDQYPGLPRRSAHERQVRVWIYPTFTPRRSWTLYDAGGLTWVRRISWAPTPTGGHHFGADARIDAAEADALLAQLRALPLSSPPVSQRIGLDGTSRGLELGDRHASIALRWWQAPPPTWREIASWHARAVAAFEAALPEPTDASELSARSD